MIKIIKKNETEFSLHVLHSSFKRENLSKLKAILIFQQRAKLEEKVKKNSVF